MFVFNFRPDGLKKAYVRLAPDYDALDVANKVWFLLTQKCERFANNFVNVPLFPLDRNHLKTSVHNELLYFTLSRRF